MATDELATMNCWGALEKGPRGRKGGVQILLRVKAAAAASVKKGKKGKSTSGRRGLRLLTGRRVLIHVFRVHMGVSEMVGQPWPSLVASTTN